MEKDLVKYDTLKPGDEFILAGFTWTKLRKDGLAIMNDIHIKMMFDTYTNDWSISDIRKYLNSIFLDILTKNGLMKDDLKVIKTVFATENNQRRKSIEIITILSQELFFYNNDIIKPLKHSYWLLTPLFGDVRYITANENTFSYANIKNKDLGVRPVICPSENTLVEKIEQIEQGERFVVLTDESDPEWSEYIKTSLSPHAIKDKINKVKSNPDWSFEDILNELGVKREDAIQAERYYF